MKHSNKKQAEAKKVNTSKTEATSLNVREIDWTKTTKDLTMIERELVCKKGDYLLDFTFKGKEFTASSLWQPGSGAADIQIACEKAVLSGVKETDLQGIVNFIAKDKHLDAKPQNTLKRRKQIARQWVKHTTGLPVAKRLAAKQS